MRIDSSRPPAWSKIKFLQHHLEAFDWMFWIDADTIIMNDEVKLEQFITEKEFSITTDRCGLCAGVFMIKSCQWSRDFLELVYNQERHINHHWWEQAAMMDIVKICSEHISYFPQWAFNSHPSTYKPKDFLMHLSGMSNNDRAKYAKDYKLMINKT